MPYTVRKTEHHHGGLFELEIDEIYEVLDDTGAVIRRYDASSSGTFHDGQGGWSMETVASITNVDIGEDGRSVRIHRGAHVTVEPLP